MRSVAEILDALGGSTAVAAALGIPMQTVASWKNRDELIPVRHWPPLISLARKRGVDGVTNETLAAIDAAARKRRNRQSAA